ncbi:glycosyltransferase [Patescibacteria group bacterium]|nr:glycosyltransferase [Patescibacteria group bacterium]
MRVALIHDHLVQHGGAERVLLAMHEAYEKAPIFTLVYDENSIGPDFKDATVVSSFLQKIPFAPRFLRWLLPLMPAATEGYDLSDFDVVLSSSSAFAKGAIPAQSAISICYCHTPTRYLWSDTHSYVSELRLPNFIKALLPLFLSRLRSWDWHAAQRVDFFVANSKNVERRIKKYYQKNSTVIYPPVETHKFQIQTGEKAYLLIGGRLVSYKRFDLAIQAANKLKIPLKIFGTGPMEAELKKMSGPTVEFLGRVSDSERTKLYENAIAFLHPHEEDFGITAVESMAAGRPVIAFRSGGALETVVENKTGIFFNDQNADALAQAIETLQQTTWDPAQIKTHAEKFSVARFQKELQTYVKNKYEEHQKMLEQ